VLHKACLKKPQQSVVEHQVTPRGSFLNVCTPGAIQYPN